MAVGCKALDRLVELTLFFMSTPGKGHKRQSVRAQREEREREIE